ncbi:MAG: putative maltokinase [Roseiflexaceae bacterium]|nr:putative maltokinase [Roseiflexaceae bacterium]
MSFPPSVYALREAVRAPALVEALPDYIRERRWFGGKARTIASARIADALPLPANSPLAYLCVVELTYQEGEPDTYLLPLAFADATQAADLRRATPQAVIANTDDLTGDAVLYDAVYDPAFCQLLLGAIERGERFGGAEGTIFATPTEAFTRLRGAGELETHVSKAEQSNTSILYGEQLILKLFRRIVPGLNPDLEIGEFLTAQGFAQIAPVAGALSYDDGTGQPATLGMLMSFVPNVGDAWSFMLGLLGQVQAELRQSDSLPRRNEEREGSEGLNSPAVGRTLDAVRMLGRRTAELHLALASGQGQEFVPEPLSAEDASAEVASMNNLADRVFAQARASLDRQPQQVRGSVQQILDREQDIRARFAQLSQQPLTAQRTRAHGDYHLGQVLATPDGDFIIIDFEGEPARSLAERRAKRSPLRDLAGMLRSFDYAAATALGELPPAQLQAWVNAASAAFLQSYFDLAGNTQFMPHSERERQVLLDAYQIEKAVYELQYELNNRPEWVRIPVDGMLRLIQL